MVAAIYEDEAIALGKTKLLHWRRRSYCIGEGEVVALGRRCSTLRLLLGEGGGRPAPTSLLIAAIREEARGRKCHVAVLLKKELLKSILLLLRTPLKVDVAARRRKRRHSCCC